MSKIDSTIVADATLDENLNEENELQAPVYMQNRELSWLTFNERVLDQGADESVLLLERLNFISIFWSNLQEFFQVRVGSLTDLSYITPPPLDSKTLMTPEEQIEAIHKRCHELYPIQERTYEQVRGLLAKRGIRHLRPNDLSEEQKAYLTGYFDRNIMPFLSPQVINSRHPFPHLEGNALYVIVRLNEDAGEVKSKSGAKRKGKNIGAKDTLLGLIPLPNLCDRLIELPGKGYQFILLEHAIEMMTSRVFTMYNIKHTNIICVTRNADLDVNEGADSSDEDYRERMKRVLKKRLRLAPVRLECERPLSSTLQKLLLNKLQLSPMQVYDTTCPLDLSFTWSLGSHLDEKTRYKLQNKPFSPQWPPSLDRKRSIIEQVSEKEVLLSYPYQSMDPLIQMLNEAAVDPSVISIKITLYRLARQSRLAEALIGAAERGKEVTALFELRARFDEANNIEWSQRFEQAGCNVIYGFRDFKVHSKICCITRQTPDGMKYITQLGTGNYNEKTAGLYTDLSFITTSDAVGRDAVEFFRNMALENLSDNYDLLSVAPLQIKPMICHFIDREISRAQAGLPAEIFLKTNSVTDKDIIEKIVEASQAGVPVTMFVRGICCLLPGIPGYTEHVRVISIVGRLLEHSRIYRFGTRDDNVMFLSSADLMTRNMDKRIEIAWPILNQEIKERINADLDTYLTDTAKLRELMPDGTYTPLGYFTETDDDGNPQPFDAQESLIIKAHKEAQIAAFREAERHTILLQNTQRRTSIDSEHLISNNDAYSYKTEADAAPIRTEDASRQVKESETPHTPATKDAKDAATQNVSSVVDASDLNNTAAGNQSHTSGVQDTTKVNTGNKIPSEPKGAKQIQASNSDTPPAVIAARKVINDEGIKERGLFGGIKRFFKNLGK